MTIFALLILCQELNPSGGFGAGGSGLLFLGHQVYFTTFSRVSVLTLVRCSLCARRADRSSASAAAPGRSGSWL